MSLVMRGNSAGAFMDRYHREIYQSGGGLVPGTALAPQVISHRITCRSTPAVDSRVVGRGTLRHCHTLEVPGVASAGRPAGVPLHRVCRCLRPEAELWSTSLSIVIPAYNEAARLSRSLGQTSSRSSGTTAPPSSWWLTMDPATGQLRSPSVLWKRRAADSPGECCVCPFNRGKGFAVRQGLLEARAPVALFSDARPLNTNRRVAEAR